MTENTVLPLINTAFEPGNARKAAESFADRDFREIAIAEFYYFFISGSSSVERCKRTVPIYPANTQYAVFLSEVGASISFLRHSRMISRPRSDAFAFPSVRLEYT